MADAKCILVTGSGGRLGRLLFGARDLLAPSGAKIIFQSRSSGRDVQWQPKDDLSALPRCDAVVALWGATSGTAEDLSVNTSLVSLSRQVARNCGADRIFHLSSAAVYGPGKGMTESAPLKPINPYGQAKCDMEAAVLSEAGPCAETCVRLANVVGADSLAGPLCGLADICLDQFSDGHGPRRSYIGAVDLLRVFVGLVQRPADLLPSSLNVAAPGSIAMEDLATAAERPFHWTTAPDTAVQEVSMDVSRMRQLLPELKLSSDAKTLIAQMQQLEAVA